MPATILRRAEILVRDRLRTMPGVSLSGARKVGKSTLARRIAGSGPCAMYDLGKPAHRRALANASDELLAHRGKTIIIDEIQRIPDLFGELRYIMDEVRDDGQTKFVLLGSATASMQGLSRSLVGRISTVQLRGLDLLEIGAQGNPQMLMERGGFPSSFLAASDKDSLSWRKSYIRQQLAMDLPELEFEVSASSLENMLHAIAAVQGRPANSSMLARNLSITQRMAKVQLSLLRSIKLVSSLPAFSNMKLMRIVGNEKYYISDIGLMNALMHGSNGSISAQKRRRLRGACWEGFVIESIRSVLPRIWSMHHYRHGREAAFDLMLADRRGKFWAVVIRDGSCEFTKQNLRAFELLKPQRIFLVNSGAQASSKLGKNKELISLIDLMKLLLEQN